MTTRAPLAELATLFLRLGATAFGGPAAHIAMMRDEVVDRRKWLTDAEFLDLLAATNLIPGPNSTEMAIHLGYRRAGLAGLVIAGVCFILPAVLIVLPIAWAYARYGETPQAAWLAYGIAPVIIAIVVQAVIKLGRAAVTGVAPALLGAGAAGLSIAGVNELLLLGGGAAAGIAVALAKRLGRGGAGGGVGAVWAFALAAGSVGLHAATVVTAAAASLPITLTRLTLFFLKVGSILFGSGYVLLAFLRADLTERWGWLTEQQLIDAVTVGQVTPGPVFTTATFIGYLLGGVPGAVLATVAIFLPGFFFVAVTQPIIPRLRASALMGGALDGVVAASLGLMLAVTWQLARAAITDVATAGVAAAAAVILVAWKPNSTWLILAGAIAGWLLHGTG